MTGWTCDEEWKPYASWSLPDSDAGVKVFLNGLLTKWAIHRILDAELPSPPCPPLPKAGEGGGIFSGENWRGFATPIFTFGKSRLCASVGEMFMLGKSIFFELGELQMGGMLV